MKSKILFVFRHDFEDLWQDGLWAALQLLSHDYEVTLCNLNDQKILSPEEYDFILGWGAFGSLQDQELQKLKGSVKGLCIAGVASPPVGCENYDVLFYETDWYKPQIQGHPNIVKAFGINTKIYKPQRVKKVWDYITVGAFALWKRQELLANKQGTKLAVGEIQRGNPQESLGIIAKLLAHKVFISDMVEPKLLASLYNMSKTAYIPCDIFGGGERAVLEAKACGIDVEVESDNPKLTELVEGPVFSESDYYEALKEGIRSCL